MMDQIEKAGPAGAIGVALALRAPPAASWIGVPPANPDPMTAPTIAMIALAATVICRTVSCDELTAHPLALR
jgi:NhaP-type Na+/H+ or K+/H+ antiporter